MSRQHHIRLQLLITTYLSVLFPRPNIQSHLDTHSEADFQPRRPSTSVTQTCPSVQRQAEPVEHPVNICLMPCMPIARSGTHSQCSHQAHEARGTCERLKRGRVQNKTFLALSILGLVEENEHDMFERREHMVRVFEASGLRFWRTLSSFVGSLFFGKVFLRLEEGGEKKSNAR